MSTLSRADKALLKRGRGVFRAIDHKLRQTILDLIYSNHNRMIVTSIYRELDIEQAVASQHLGILRKAGLVSTERQGKFIYYSVNTDKIREVLSIADLLTNKSFA